MRSVSSHHLNNRNLCMRGDIVAMPRQAGYWEAIILANNCLPVALVNGNRPPSTTTVATVAALGAAAGYLAYAAYNYQQGDSKGKPIAVETLVPRLKIQSMMTLTKRKTASRPCRGRFAHISAQTYTDILCRCLGCSNGHYLSSVTVAQPSRQTYQCLRHCFGARLASVLLQVGSFLGCQTPNAKEK